MKKTIKILLEKMDRLQEKKDGTLQGGFASIRGGFHETEDTTNSLPGCTNNGDCTKVTNRWGCVNNGTCFM